MLLRYPLDKIKITQSFGERPDVYKPLRGHNGIDFKTQWEDSPDGERPVYAAANGVVVECGDQGKSGYGKFVRLQHVDGSETIYGHLSVWSVKANQSIFVGKQIGISGNTGFSSAPHLHFGYRPPNFNKYNGFGGYINPRSSISYSMSPYFEQKELESAICVVDFEKKQNIPFESGDLFKLLYGDYSWVQINKVKEWSYPVQKELIRKI
jgi:murein DD-endopeptidase MepM/ murein hydrolase activator NlpD